MIEDFPHVNRCQAQHHRITLVKAVVQTFCSGGEEIRAVIETLKGKVKCLQHLPRCDSSKQRIFHAGKGRACRQVDCLWPSLQAGNPNHQNNHQHDRQPIAHAFHEHELPEAGFSGGPQAKLKARLKERSGQSCQARPLARSARPFLHLSVPKRHPMAKEPP